MMERAMEHLNVQLNRLTRSLRRARTVDLPEGETSRDTMQTFLFFRITGVVKETLDTFLSSRILVQGHTRSSTFIHIGSFTTKYLTFYLDDSHENT